MHTLSMVAKTVIFHKSCAFGATVEGHTGTKMKYVYTRTIPTGMHTALIYFSTLGV